MAGSFRFGTVGSPLATLPRPGGSVGGILTSASLGLTALELAWVQGVRVRSDTCRAIRETAGRSGVALSVHAPYYINLNADEQKWPRLRGCLVDAARYGSLAGATDIVFHPGTYFGQPAEQVLRRALPRLEGCLQELSALEAPVTLRPETMGKAALIGSLEDVLVLSRLPGVQPCLDFAHLHARPADGSLNSYDAWMRLIEHYASVLGPAALKTMHIHLSGIEVGPRGERRHLKLEEADLDVPGLFRALLDSGAGGRLLLESPVMEEDALRARDLWSQLSGEELG